MWISNKTNFNDTSPQGLALRISWSQSSFNCHREGKIVSQPSPNVSPLGTIAQNGFECIELKWQSSCRVGLSIGGQTITWFSGELHSQQLTYDISSWGKHLHVIHLLRIEQVQIFFQNQLGKTNQVYIMIFQVIDDITSYINESICVRKKEPICQTIIHKLLFKIILKFLLLHSLFSNSLTLS